MATKISGIEIDKTANYLRSRREGQDGEYEIYLSWKLGHCVKDTEIKVQRKFFFLNMYRQGKR